MLTIRMNEKKTQTAAMVVCKDVTSNATERLTAIGIYEELRSFRTALAVTDGRLTRIVRKVISCAYERKEPKLIDDLISFFKVFKTAKFGAAIKAACESVAFVSFENGKAKIADYSKKARAERALANKAFGVLLNYEQAQQALAAQKALERKQSVVPLEDLRSAKGTIGVFYDEFQKLYDKKSRDLERARAMADTNKNKDECIRYLETQTQVCRTMSLLLNKLKGLSADKANELLQKIEAMNN